MKTKNSMCPTNPSSSLVTPNRRSFLRGISALGLGALAGRQTSAVVPVRYAHRFQLFAEGTVSDFSLVWPAPEVPPLPPETLLRIRVEFPVQGKDILEFRTFVAPVSDPSLPVFIVTFFRMRVDKIGLSDTPFPNFGLFGQVIDNPVVDNPNHSPFGDLTGHIGTAYGGFDTTGDQTTFTLLGGQAAGSHASAVPTATGSLHIVGPWDSL
jgi:hypothetical protein